MGVEGQKAKSRSGAVGHPYGAGRVMNVLPLQDREVVFDGENVEVAGTASWVVLGNDTINLTTDLDRRVGTESMEFDKVNGAANTKLAGVSRTAGLDLDVSRFLDGVVSLGIQMSSVADVAAVHLRLGTSSTDYTAWSWADDELAPGGAWSDLHARFDEGTVNGNGWNPADVKYAAFYVEFDAETDALADILVDYVAVTEGYPADAALNGVNLDSVTAATDGGWIDTSRATEVTVCVAVSGNTGAVTINIEHSPDGTAEYALDSKVYTAVNQNDDWSYRSRFKFMRVTTTTHANATVKATITGKLE